MKPKFVVVSRLNYACCCGMAKRLCRHNPGLRVLRLVVLWIASLFGAFGVLVLLLQHRAGLSTWSTSLGYLVIFLLLLGIGGPGLPRLWGYLLLRRFRCEHLPRMRFLVYDDGIQDDTIPTHGQPYAFLRYSGFCEDRARFYLFKEGQCFPFDKKGFATGKPEQFRAFIRQELRSAALLEDSEESDSEESI